jgi:pimeloyl-ACP methyl ester carboxylesterase
VSSPHETATPPFGRDKDLEVLHAFVDQSSSDGGAVMLSGAPGVGKTVLLAAVAGHSADAGLRVLSARTGRREEAVAHVAAAREANLGLISSRLALLTEASAGIAAIKLDGSFERALAVPDAELWVFDLARVELAYGERLRRAKQTAAARAQLATDDRMIPPAAQRAMCERIGATTVEVAASHAVYLSQPDAVAALISAAAEATTSS